MNIKTNRIALVTGGSRGLGRCEVLSIAERGIHCIFTYNSKREEADEVVAAASAHGVQVRALHLDLGQVASFDGFVTQVQTALAEMGVQGLDYLINNGGISYHSKYAEVREEDLDRLYAVNFKGVFFLTQKLLPVINEGGRIINTSSGLTRFVFPNLMAYASIKGALEPFTRYLAQEVGARGITVNTLAPGAMGTDFSGGMIRDNPEYRKRISEATALGRPGVPDDIGPMVASLLSDENRWVNAQRIEVSGGMKL